MIPAEIEAFLSANHLLHLTACHQGELWAASCFYVYDEATVSLIILTASQTRHGQLMLVSPQVVGTIAPQVSEIAEIEGVQFAAQAVRLSGKTAEQALAHYCERHPVARKMPSEVWALQLNFLKHTSNRQQFGQKLYWERE